MKLLCVRGEGWLLWGAVQRCSELPVYDRSVRFPTAQVLFATNQRDQAVMNIISKAKQKHSRSRAPGLSAATGVQMRRHDEA